MRWRPRLPRVVVGPRPGPRICRKLRRDAAGRDAIKQWFVGYLIRERSSPHSGTHLRGKRWQSAIARPRHARRRSTERVVLLVCRLQLWTLAEDVSTAQSAGGRSSDG